MCFSFFEHRREKAETLLVPWLGQSSSHVGWHFDKGVDRPTVGFPRSPVDFQSANCRAHKWNYIRLLAIPVELKMLVPKTFNLDKVPIYWKWTVCLLFLLVNHAVVFQILSLRCEWAFVIPLRQVLRKWSESPCFYFILFIAAIAA